MEEELKLKIFKQEGASSNGVESGYTFMLLGMAPLLITIYVEDPINFTLTLQNILLVLWIIFSLMAGIQILYANRKLSKGKMLLTVNKEGIDKTTWNEIVNLKINFTGFSAQISFDHVIGTYTFYHVKLDRKNYESLIRLKNEFFDPTNKIM